jgi:protein tyrosine phosphatase (PTP) superfamily phosphohydrolase (DUF442 family)
MGLGRLSSGLGLGWVCLGLWVGLGGLPEAVGQQAGNGAGGEKPKLQASALGQTKNVHLFGKTLLCGQPTAEAFAQAKARGIAVVITLREPSEIDWDERQVVEKLGLKFHQLSFSSADTLTDAVLDQSLQLLAKSAQQPVLLHCGSANRVGAIWAAHRVLNDGLEMEDALEEAKEVGLRIPALADKVQDYVRRKQTKP